MLIKEESAEGMQTQKNSKGGDRWRKASRTPASTAYRSPEGLAFYMAEVAMYFRREQIRHNYAIAKLEEKKIK